jgi:multicomponent K+:H+ antiporter subunit F
MHWIAAIPRRWSPPSRRASKRRSRRSSNAEHRPGHRVRAGRGRLRHELSALLKGPHAPDRILALDTLYINAIALLVLLGIHLASPLYFEAALLIALMGFVGTVALAKFLLRGDIIE